MTELFTGDGQSPLGDLSGMQELAPPVFFAPPIVGTIDFEYSSGAVIDVALQVAGAGSVAQGGLVRLVQYTPAGSAPTGSVISARHVRLSSSGLGSPTALDQTRGRSWTDPLVDVGTGMARALATDPDLSVFQWDGNDILQFKLNDEIAYAVPVDTPALITAAPGEEKDQGWLLGGRGHLSLIERGVVYPIGGVGRKPAQEDRVWNWADPDYDDTGWVGAHIVTFIYWVQPLPVGGNGQWGLLNGSWDVNFSDQTARLLWSGAGTIVTAPVGKVYGRQWFFMSAADDHAYFQGEADNVCDYYLNGQLILSTTNYATRNDADISIPAGWNLLATVCENRPPAFAANPASWAWACWDYGYPPNLYAHSDESCKILAYPASVPGMPVGQVMLIAIAEAQARGALLWLNPMFTATHDSEGQLWPVAEISTKVGTDLLTFFAKELAETYIDLWMAPASTDLYAWVKGGRGGSSGLTVHTPTSPTDPTTGNLTALAHEMVL